MKAAGVDTLFLEEVMYDSEQSILDAYLKAPGEAPFPLTFDPYLIHIINAAKQQKIRVVGIGTTLSMFATEVRGVYKDVKTRLETMNFSAVQIMEKERGEGKFVAFVGLVHLANHYEETPGISQLLGCPNLLIHDGDELGFGESHDEEVMKGVRYTGALLSLPVNPVYREQWGVLS